MSEVATPAAGRSGAGLGRVLSDGHLARRAVRGDEHAFAAIFARYHQRLYRYCLAIVGSPQDAQDALQNTMVKVLRALPGEERKIELKPWLYRIAHNESIELLRRRRETRELDAELPAPGSGLAEEAASRERLRRLISDLDELPDRQRGALVMRELSGLDYDAIGTALGTSGAVARQTLYEARLSLRQMDEGRDMNCETVAKALSDGDGRVTRRRDLRAHLRSCPSCRRFGEEISGRERDFAVLAPLPAVAAAGLLQG
ncbi:MAG: RNA polymerase sigma factor, partial [Solirubrobacterales bacterium]